MLKDRREDVDVGVGARLREALDTRVEPAGKGAGEAPAGSGEGSQDTEEKNRGDESAQAQASAGAPGSPSLTRTLPSGGVGL
jgi:hypothetical protein